MSSKIKCVLVGDEAVGKTSLVVSYTTNGYPHEYVPTAMDRYDVVVHVDNEPITLEMCDTPGQSEFEHLRRLCYPDAHVFILCFSVMEPHSLANAKQRWMPEIHNAYSDVSRSRKNETDTRRATKNGSRSKKKQRQSDEQSPVPPIILVGTQSDLRSDAASLLSLAETKRSPIAFDEALKTAQAMGCVSYVETSSVTQKQLKELFDLAITEGIGFSKMRNEHMENLRTSNNQEKEEDRGKNSKRCAIL